MNRGSEATDDNHLRYDAASIKLQPSSNCDLKIGAADTNFKKQFESIGDALFTEDNAEHYVDTLRFISPIFVNAVTSQIDGISDRKLGELLGIDHILDAKAVRAELNKLSKQRA